MEKRFKVDLFNRQSLAFIVKEKVQQIHLSQFSYALDNHFIGPETLYFNNTVLTKKELEEKWIIPLKNSWLARKIQP
jgi:hypothetical protein